MKALVIDDSRTMRRIVSSVLRGIGYEAIEAGDGQEALDALQANDGVILCCIDWNMPVMDGLTFVTKVRERAEWRDITLMMVTTEAEQANIVRALAETYGGSVQALASPLGGARLRLCLPAAD